MYKTNLQLSTLFVPCVFLFIQNETIWPNIKNGWSQQDNDDYMPFDPHLNTLIIHTFCSLESEGWLGVAQFVGSFNNIEACEQLVVAPTYHLLHTGYHPDAKATCVTQFGSVVLEVICVARVKATKTKVTMHNKQ